MEAYLEIFWVEVWTVTVLLPSLWTGQRDVGSRVPNPTWSMGKLYVELGDSLRHLGIKPPDMPSQFIVSAPKITTNIWIGIGNQWTLSPLEPPQLQCVRKLKPGEVVTVNDGVCWKSIGQETTLT